MRPYPSSHDTERAAWAPIVAAGTVECRRGRDCLLWPALLIEPGAPWDLGHPDAACDAPIGPEHERCNRSTATWKAKAGMRPREEHPALRALHSGS